MCLRLQIKYAVLAENSPSCGSSNIYDGRFSGTKVNGSGVIATLLESSGIKLFKRDSQRVAFLPCVGFSV
ncbi:DUF523 domain-containing protein [Vibrio parahaemolyticus]|uniref:DUF523 domain-containing protein n=1 Tax=Vibrio parahaemolyticus TaxID=670 RepID=UPI0027E45805|nr:DUF523 domain-containing protein [Vibrio parahaemolyticus]